MAFADTFSDALLGAGQLDRARQVLEKLLREKNEGVARLFELADAYADAKKDGSAVEILTTLKRRMFSDKKQNDFITQMDVVIEKHPQSQGILEFSAVLYNELNRESKYFEILIKLFDVYVQVGSDTESLRRARKTGGYRRVRLSQPGAAGNAAQPRGRFFFQARGGAAGQVVESQRGVAFGAPAMTPPSEVVTSSQPVTEAGRESQTLEDLIVQTEIFLQYSLHNKALDRLQRIGVMFPGEEKRNARLSNLYALANWWPPGAHRQQPSPTAARTPSGASTAAAGCGAARIVVRRSKQERCIYGRDTARPVENIRSEPENFPAADSARDVEHGGE